MRPTRTVSLSSPEASEDSSSGRPCSIAVWTASPSSIATLGVAWCSSKGADPSRRRGNRRPGSVTTRRLISTRSPPLAAVAASPDEHAAPAVVRVLGRAGDDSAAEFAGERGGEQLAGVDVLARAGVQGVRVPALEQLVESVGSEGGGAQVAVDPGAEGGEEADRVERERRGEFPRAAGRRGQEHADRTFHMHDRFELAVGEPQPGVRRERPAAQVVGVEAVRVRERPAREVAARRRVHTETAGDRRSPVAGGAPDGRVVEIDRQLRVRAGQRGVELRRRAVTLVQSNPAARSASAWPSINRWTALSSRRDVRTSVMPCRRSTASACASSETQASRSLGSSGALAARRRRLLGRSWSSGAACRGKAACELAAGVGLDCASRERVAFSGRGAIPTRRRRARPGVRDGRYCARLLGDRGGGGHEGPFSEGGGRGRTREGVRDRLRASRYANARLDGRRVCPGRRALPLRRVDYWLFKFNQPQGFKAMREETHGFTQVASHMRSSAQIGDDS